MTMAKPRMDLSAFVGKLLEEQDGDVLREGIATPPARPSRRSCAPSLRSPITPRRSRSCKVAKGLRACFAKAAALFEDAAEDVLACRHLPLEHQRQLPSTNTPEWLNKEIKRRSQVVGIFPNPAAVIRLVGAVLLEQDDEWAVAERRYFSAESMSQLAAPALSSTAQEIMETLA